MFDNWKVSDDSLFTPYKNHAIQLIILETLLLNDDILIENLHWTLIDRMKNNDLILSSTTLPYVKDRVIYLAKLNLLEVDGEKDTIRITEKGIELLRAGTIQNIAATTFFNYRAFNTSFWAFIISIFAALFSLLALFKK